MSPLFHRADDGTEEDGQRHGRLPSLYEFGPQIAEAVNSAAALPLEEFAAQLMTRYFTTDYLLAPQITSMVAVDTICWDLLPDSSGEHLGEPIPDPFFCLQDLVTEALQLLRNAGLVMQRSYKVAQDTSHGQWLDGLVTTRRGRAALANGTVGQILGRVYPPPA
jgi:hypothetical protein